MCVGTVGIATLSKSPDTILPNVPLPWMLAVCKSMPLSLAMVLAKGLTKRRDGCALVVDVAAGAGWVTAAGVGGAC